MRRPVENILGMMFDEQARRALEETVLDWSHEVDQAHGMVARLVCHVRAALAVVRTLIVIVLHDLGRLPGSGVWIRVGLWLVVSFFLYWPTYATHLAMRAGLTDQVVAAALLFPSWAVMFGPIALFMASLWRPHPGGPSTPFLGLAILSAGVVFVCAGWIVPAANQEFRQRTFAMYGGQHELPRGAAERTFPELVSESYFQPAHAVRLQLSNRLALVAACPIMILLASQMQFMRRRYRWVVAPLLLWGAGIAVEGGVKLGVIDKTLSIWVYSAAALVAAVTIASVRPRPGSRPESVHA